MGRCDSHPHSSRLFLFDKSGAELLALKRREKICLKVEPVRVTPG